MASIGFLILENSHQKTIHIEIDQITQSSLEMDGVEYAVLDITMEDKHLWHTQLVKFLRDGILPINLTNSTKKVFKLKYSHFCMLGDVLYH